ncbi:virulence RhuM family protein [Bacteroides sp. OttesenSCG-928-J23]|nr:virulence RhuM family protein [Bacteroides sp. OttesenSCG-928-N06]MDL2247961.1 virulence RhuM family protein [Bacteroides sp. OttesenSCG-928-J23]MDL2305307.1 virulence RhuM family protein [Bacteroides sp. OttesenSCG-928-D19]
MENQGEIILYQPNEAVRVEVRLEDETVWLTQAQMAELFDVKENTITYHIKEVYNTNELEVEPTTRKIRVVRKEGNRNVHRNLDFYNLDMIISIGYRVGSKRGVQFRQWANQILKDHLLKGYSINQRLSQLEDNVNTRFIDQQKQIGELKDKVDFFVHTSLPPVEGIFFDGQIFDAYTFATNLIKSAKQRIILIDNYIDESVLLMLSKRSTGVKTTIFTGTITPQLKLDISKHNSQYPNIEIKQYRQSHDRFLIVDNTDVYHIDASLKDLGKKWFAFSKINIPAQDILSKLP